MRRVASRLTIPLDQLTNSQPRGHGQGFFAAAPRSQLRSAMPSIRLDLGNGLFYARGSRLVDVFLTLLRGIGVEAAIVLNVRIPAFGGCSPCRFVVYILNSVIVVSYSDLVNFGKVRPEFRILGVSPGAHLLILR
jgi:hypothetical protein